MKRIALLFLLILTLPAVSQQVIRPSTADYRYQIFDVGDLTITNWYEDFFYADLPQGKIYRRQLSETGVWRDCACEDIVVPVIPGATATFSEGIDILPTPPPIHFFRLTMVATTDQTATITLAEARPVKTDNKTAFDRMTKRIMASQPKGAFSSKKKFKYPVVIDVPPHGKLIYTKK